MNHQSCLSQNSRPSQPIQFYLNIFIEAQERFLWREKTLNFLVFFLNDESKPLLLPCHMIFVRGIKHVKYLYLTFSVIVIKY